MNQQFRLKSIHSTDPKPNLIEQQIIEQILPQQQQQKQKLIEQQRKANLQVEQISQQLQYQQPIEQKKPLKYNQNKYNVYQRSASMKQKRKYYEQQVNIEEEIQKYRIDSSSIRQQPIKFYRNQYQAEINRNYYADKTNYRMFIPCQRVTAQLVERKPKKVQKKVEEKKKKEEDVQKEMKHNTEFEEYFEKCKYQFCGKDCKMGYKIQMICVQKECHSQAQHCLNPQCAHCRNNHAKCSIKFTYEMFKGILERNLGRQKKAMQIVYQSYTNIINEIKKNMQKAIKLICVQGITQSLINTLEQREVIYKHISFKSKQILQVFDLLNIESQSNHLRQSRIYQKIKKDQKDIISKIQEENHLIFRPYSVNSLTVLNSHLLTEKNDIKYVLEQLNYPKSMKLLYRASQNEFSIKKFHQICDQQENTFTIIKTQFGKFIGGYTPLKWNTKHGRDRSNKTFLLAINLKQKIQHINHGECAICCQPNLGPSFGGMFDIKDIQIFYENGSLVCRTAFPNTYNWKKFFTPCQESWKFLTGAENGNMSRIIDYEIFKVLL